MIYLLDAHTLVWYLERNPRLSAIARQVLVSPDSNLAIPSIALAEIHHLYHRKRIRTSPEEIRARIFSAANCSVYRLNELVLERLPPSLEIHDAIIVATVLVLRDVLNEPARLITCDQRITESRLVETYW